MLLVPVTDTSISTLNVVVKQDSEMVHQTIRNFYFGDIHLSECNDKVILNFDRTNHNLKYALIEGFSYKLKEGHAKVFISVDADTSKADKYDYRVFWNNKPRSLMNPVFAINMLKPIESQDAINDLLSSSKEDLYNNLLDYWNKKTHNNGKPFNELMNEYYTRVDFAVRNYSTVDKANGAVTDRGMIYIRYGKPDSVERTYPRANQILEIWDYKNLNKQFVFEDVTGLGNYNLVK